MLVPLLGNEWQLGPRAERGAAPLQAIKETFTVVAIVAVSAVLLFGLNAVLNEGAELLYSLKRS